MPPGPIAYARSLPRTKALQPEVLIAYQMNGRDLSLDHGYPVRAVVPGHYGMASVKWLTPSARSEKADKRGRRRNGWTRLCGMRGGAGNLSGGRRRARASTPC